MTEPTELSHDAAWRVAEIRAAEARLMARLSDGALMARAAHGLTRVCASLLTEGPGVYGSRVVLLVGRGNNGGDALYAGALLARRGASVTAVAATTSVTDLHPGGSAALAAAGGRVFTVGSLDVSAVLGRSQLIVDGLVGIGGRGPLRDPAAGLVAAAMAARRDRGVPVVAVDVPSGVNSDTGETEASITADVTVTFGCLKPGLVLEPGAWRTGRLERVDIGLGPELREDPALQVTPEAMARRSWPQPRHDDDKYRRGVVGVVAGSSVYPGAALLAVGGALAGPAGMVRFVGGSASEVVARHPEVVATTELAEAGQAQAWVVGPGMGLDETADRRLRAVLERKLPTVIDSDGITLVARALASGGVAAVRLGGDTVLTPHAREFARLTEALRTREDLPASPDHPLSRVQTVADALGVTVLLKGNRTIIASPGRVPLVNPTGTPALATAGSGDVLSGLLGSLLAAGVSPHEAAASAAYVHGLAGIHASQRGPVTASALAASLPVAVNQITRGDTIDLSAR